MQCGKAVEIIKVLLINGRHASNVIYTSFLTENFVNNSSTNTNLEIQKASKENTRTRWLSYASPASYISTVQMILDSYLA